MKPSFLAASLLLVSSAAYAETPAPVTPALPVLTLSAQANTKAATDEMVVAFRSEREGTSLGTLNQAVLSELQTAITQAKALPGVRARLGSVRTHQTYSPQGKVTGWRVQGEVVLESQKLKELGDLAGHLSQKLQLANVSFRLSKEKRLELEKSLLSSAAQAFSSKAQASSEALGYAGFTIKDVNISQAAEGGHEVVPMYAKSMAMREAAPVSMPAEAGEVEVTVTMSGSVTLTR